MDNLHFFGRENYVDYLWAKYVTGHAYFQNSGLLLYENSVLSIYAPQSEINYIRKYTNHFIQNPKDIQRLVEQFRKIKKEIKSESSFFSKHYLKATSNKELYDRFTKLIDILVRYITLYRITERHYVEHIEKEVLEIIQSKTSTNAQEVLAKFLSNEEPEYFENLFSQEEYFPFKVLNTVAKVRFDGRKIVEPLVEFSERILEEAATRNDLAANQISNLDLKELEKLLIKNEVPNLEVVNKRQHAFALKITKMNETIRVTDLSEKKLQELITYDKGRSNVSELKGDIGYPGKISGIARIAPLLSGPEEYSHYVASLKKTDVLIAPMTGPGLTPAFSTVAAVVTDEGGLMSHAALIAREKKVPCVLGTRTATRTFKDGEQITVDATIGIVRKNK